MDEKFRFEFDLTEEQIEEMEEALRDHQFKYYAKSMDANPENKQKALAKFMVIEDILNQFANCQLKYEAEKATE